MNGLALHIVQSVHPFVHPAYTQDLPEGLNGLSKTFEIERCASQRNIFIS